MSDKCLFPGCNRHPQKNSYCIGHRIYASGTEVKMPKEPNKVSDKMKDIKKALKSLYPAFLKSRPVCKIKSPVRTHKADVVHHDSGRDADTILDQSTWVECCAPCNGYVEEHDAWARERGFKKSRHQKKTPADVA